ncbi:MULTISPECIES: YqaJ viral recombinase family protein [Bacillus]|uniref:YqaJ viral recombinase family nuclease n=1 Tax=Bacillus TaxID=1386 RepID=UPI000E59F2FA|nr:MULTISPECIES: YqaJ viral recombinase family protein [Bacillus]MCM3250448.1 YqaJ viral recombinase family protein [Bacillus amyloliquefaciens]MCY7426881.1 YqaJ viral recombinase family protein [Bacillus amyloliquefaciens]MEC0965448.1 YqaJ viral recombinase family protein [Bacillus amyloliquefaciens]MEC1013075.1 YqaJ viral recombinase family protein [Bacillus amyloliquefaciens]MEC2262539.1 YqaJ viral recombinase family protein [Bacillus amyloliquefaciens]
MQAEIFAKTADMSREEWLMERRKGIGGSDASVILGLNKWRTAFELWLDKTGQVPVSESASEAAYFGSILEDIVAKEFEVRSGKKVRRKKSMLKHPEYDFILANVDRMIVGEKAILECKTTSEYNLKEWENDEIPADYIVQVQHYLGVLGPEYKKAYFAVLIGGNKFVWKEIERDDELIEMIFTAEVEFWNAAVLGGVAPALDGSSAAEEYLKKRYAETESNKVIDLTAVNRERIKQYLQLKESIAELQLQAKELENQIKHEMKEAEYGFIGNYQASWKPVVSNRIDTNKLKEQFPDVYEKVTKEVQYRRFGIKEVS